MRSVEDLGTFMEMITPEFQGKIMMRLYKANIKELDESTGNYVVVEKTVTLDMLDPKVLSDEDGQELLRNREEFLNARKLYAWKRSGGIYGMNDDKTRVVMLTRDEIAAQYPGSEKHIGAKNAADKGRGRVGGEAKEYWEAVRVVNPAEFINWIHSYWMYKHNDDPNNPVQFFQEIVVSHPDQRGAVNASRMHTDSGTFLTSRFLTDPITGAFRVYKKTKDALINHTWVPGEKRNDERKLLNGMHSDQQIAGLYRDITADNMEAKTAAGGQSVVGMYFSMGAEIHEDFDLLTGDPLKRAERERLIDVRLGSGINLVYNIYNRISNYEGLKQLVGEDALMFTREGVARAVLEYSGIFAPENLEDKVKDSEGNELDYTYYEEAKRILATYEDPDTMLHEDFYYPKGHELEGQLRAELEDAKPNESKDEKKARKARNKKIQKNIEKFVGYLNPYYPPTKNLTLINVIRKLVENQMQDTVGLEKSPAVSGLAEQFAWMRTYQDGISATNDIGVGGRDSFAKFNFLRGYKDKQSGRDRAGNSNNIDLLLRSVLPFTLGMPTVNGETVIDILENALTIQLNARERYAERLKVLTKKGSTENVGTTSETASQVKEKLLKDIGDEAKDESAIFAAYDPETASLINQIRDAREKLKTMEKQQVDEGFVALQYRIHELEKDAHYSRLRFLDPELNEGYREYTDKNIDKQYLEALKRLEFEDAAYVQFGAMHVGSGGGLFNLEMESKDMPVEDLIKRDENGRIGFSSKAFGEWLEGIEKTMRYLIETYKAPLGAEEDRLVNPRDKENSPKHVSMPIVETMFGTYNSRVLLIVQEMVNRHLEEHRVSLNKKIEGGEDLDNKDVKKVQAYFAATGKSELASTKDYLDALVNPQRRELRENAQKAFTDLEAKYNLASDEEKKILKKKLDLAEHEMLRVQEELGDLTDLQFVDEKGNLGSLVDDDGDPIDITKSVDGYDTKEAKARRRKLRAVVGFVHYEKDKEGRILGSAGRVDPVFRDPEPAGLFTRAYAMGHITGLIKSHSDTLGKSVLWSVEKREDAFMAMELSNYFGKYKWQVDIIRQLSGNDKKLNLTKGVGVDAGKGFGEGIKGVLKNLGSYLKKG